MAMAVVIALMPAPAPAAGLFESLFGGLGRALNGAPPPPPAPVPQPVSANPNGYYPTNHNYAPRPWQGAARQRGTIAEAGRVSDPAPMGDPTLRPGDVVATADGLRVYTGGRRGLPDFVPVKDYPYFGAHERNELLATQVTPPDRRWGAEGPDGGQVASAASGNAQQPDNLDEFASLRTTQR